MFSWFQLFHGTAVESLHPTDLAYGQATDGMASIGQMALKRNYLPKCQRKRLLMTWPTSGALKTCDWAAANTTFSCFKPICMFCNITIKNCQYKICILIIKVTVVTHIYIYMNICAIYYEICQKKVYIKQFFLSKI